MTELVAMDSKQLTSEQSDLIKRTIAKGASDDELSLFLANCNRTQLDPFSRQIYCVGRFDKKAGREVFQTQVSIDGARLVAQRTGEYAGQTPVMWTADGKEWVEVWLDDSSHPKAARVGVYRKGFVEPIWAVATWTEYAAEGKYGLTPMWKKMGPLMLGKCAEMLALRKAFPMELSGLYSSDEMSQADAPPVSRRPDTNPAPDTTITGILPPQTVRQPPAALHAYTERDEAGDVVDVTVDVDTGEIAPASVPETNPDDLMGVLVDLINSTPGNLALKGELLAKFGPSKNMSPAQVQEAINYVAGWAPGPDDPADEPLPF